MVVPQPTGVGLNLQCRGPSSPPHVEQQGLPQAVPALEGAVRHHGSTLARRLQVETHRRRGLHQRLEH